jgi:ATPase subunit of ABC transporter with duplicated ATPase domains
VALADRAVVRRGGFVLGPVTLEISRGDRVVIAGANGSGKSTLLSLLTGAVAPESGTTRLGSGVRIGRVAQAREQFNGSESPLEVLRHELGLAPAQLRTLLAKYSLAGDDALRPGASLSAGERTRAAMALISAQEVNLLALDEPTNHLDLEAIEQLESALTSFRATMLLVTHDRRLLAGVRATRYLWVANGQVREEELPPAGRGAGLRP